MTYLFATLMLRQLGGLIWRAIARFRNLMAERGLEVDHSTIARWVIRYAPFLNQRMRRYRRHANRSWRVDETYVRVAGQWTYLYRALDSMGNTIDFLLSPYRDRVAAKQFLQLALSRVGRVRPRVINVDGHPTYPSVISELNKPASCRRPVVVDALLT